VGTRLDTWVGGPSVISLALLGLLENAAWTNSEQRSAPGLDLSQGKTEWNCSRTSRVQVYGTRSRNLATRARQLGGDGWTVCLNEIVVSEAVATVCDRSHTFEEAGRARAEGRPRPEAHISK
jgi:hypothetical protein